MSAAFKPSILLSLLNDMQERILSIQKTAEDYEAENRRLRKRLKDSGIQEDKPEDPPGS